MDSAEFARLVSEADLPGATGMIVNAEGIVAAHQTGLANTENAAPMTLDTPCQIASMTKALVAVAALQLVEAEKLNLNGPIEAFLPQLAKPQVLTGFADDGSPETRDAVRSVTLRYLLTHTSGFGYAFVQKDVLQYFVATGMPEAGERKAIEVPLLFDPGDDWAYGVSMDWVGLAIEAVTGERLRDYLRENVLGPLGMDATGFHDTPPEGLAGVHARLPDGGFATLPLFLGGGEFDNGGGGLVSTANDYVKFLRAMLRGGELDGNRILSEASMADIECNQIGNLRAGRMETTMPEVSNVYDALPDQDPGWGLGMLVNREPGPNGRAPGSMSWAGVFNSYYWIDPASDRAGLFMTQLSPFGDRQALEVFGALERAAYA